MAQENLTKKGNLVSSVKEQSGRSTGSCPVGAGSNPADARSCVLSNFHFYWSFDEDTINNDD